MPLAKRWRFRGYEFDGCSGELRRGGHRTFTPPHLAKVLEALLERPGVLVEREALARRLWREHPLMDVDHGLTAAVSRLRALLGDDPCRPRFIETVPGRGYRFVSPCSARGAYSSLAVLPFDDFGDAHARSVADELGEELTSTLASRLPQRVVSWISASTCRATARRLPEIAADLDVDAVVVGGVLLTAALNRVTVDLLDARADAHVWAGGYDAGTITTPLVVVDLAATIADDVAAALGSAGDAVGAVAAPAVVRR
jgi:DNA-binding winged helix-turn-helix (wHTH) protein